MIAPILPTYRFLAAFMCKKKFSSLPNNHYFDIKLLSFFGTRSVTVSDSHSSSAVHSLLLCISFLILFSCSYYNRNHIRFVYKWLAVFIQFPSCTTWSITSHKLKTLKYCFIRYIRIYRNHDIARKTYICDNEESLNDGCPFWSPSRNP